MSARLAAPAVGASRWRTTPRRLARLLVGLWLFGAGEALIVRAGLGNTPWTVLAEGVALHTALTIGGATVLIAAVVLLAWVPLRERPGLGTVLNVLLIGVALDVTLLVVPAVEGLAVRWLLLVVGVLAVGLGSGLYLGSDHGPGPRDGLMTGISRRTGRPVALVRGAIELSVLAAGWSLGGTVGLGTVAFALVIGPAVAFGLWVTGTRGRRRAVVP